MIYIISLVIITILSIYFDFYCNGKSNKASIFYNLLLIWFISVSGFAYNVGSDIPAYMDEYDGFCQFFSFYSLSDIFTFENRQPAWVLLNIICGAISDNFLTLKLIIASFVNSCIFYFIKRRTRYYFLGVLFYSVFLYLNLNFNALRQSVSIAFFLLAYLDFADRKYGRYCAWAICAFLFHVSGIISFILPLLKYVRVNSKSLFLYGIILVLLLLVALMMVFRLNIYAVLIANAFFAFLVCVLNSLALSRYAGYQQEVVKTFVIPAIAALLMGVVAYGAYALFYYVIKSNLVSIIISIVVAVITYAVTLLLLKGLGEDELRKFPKGHLLIALAMVVLLFSLTGCGSNKLVATKTTEDEMFGKYEEKMEIKFKDDKAETIVWTMEFEDEDKAESTSALFKLLENDEEFKGIEVEQKGKKVVLTMDAKSFASQQDMDDDSLSKDEIKKS